MYDQRGLLCNQLKGQAKIYALFKSSRKIPHTYPDHGCCIDDTVGTLINDGNRTAVIGIAFPRLQDNLAIDSEKINIPDYVEIAADEKTLRLV